MKLYIWQLNCFGFGIPLGFRAFDVVGGTDEGQKGHILHFVLVAQSTSSCSVSWLSQF